MQTLQSSIFLWFKSQIQNSSTLNPHHSQILRDFGWFNSLIGSCSWSNPAFQNGRQLAGVASDTTGLEDLEDDLSELESITHDWERAISEVGSGRSGDGDGDEAT